MERPAPHTAGKGRTGPKLERKGFWEQYTPEARAVLSDLLDKYTDHGVTQLDDLQILEVPPLSNRGTPVEIASLFGGPAQLRQAVTELQTLLYG